MTEKLIFGEPSDARTVRELLVQAGLDAQTASLELGIDEATLRSYCTGTPVPRYIVLALERLVDRQRVVESFIPAPSRPSRRTPWENP